MNCGSENNLVRFLGELAAGAGNVRLAIRIDQGGFAVHSDSVCLECRTYLTLGDPAGVVGSVGQEIHIGLSRAGLVAGMTLEVPGQNIHRC